MPHLKAYSHWMRCGVCVVTVPCGAARCLASQVLTYAERCGTAATFNAKAHCSILCPVPRGTSTQCNAYGVNKPLVRVSICAYFKCISGCCQKHSYRLTY